MRKRKTKYKLTITTKIYENKFPWIYYVGFIVK